MSDTITKPEVVTTEDDAQAELDFAAGEAMEQPGAKAPAADGGQHRDESGRFTAPPAAEPAPRPDAKPAGKTDAKPAAGKDGAQGGKTPAADAKPEYVQITKDQFAELTTAVAQTKEFEKQFSKVFGTVGDMQKILRGLQAQTPKGAAVKLPPGAFDAMKKDFPELAAHMETAMTEILKGAEGTGTAPVDPEDFEKRLEARVLKMAADDLAEEFPDWRKVVGACDTSKGEKPDPDNAFRKWLATKPKDYQDRINTTNSAGVITRAIRTFKSETKTPAPAPAPNKQAQQRAARIQDSVRPKGDAGHPPASKTEDDFESGFATG